MKRLFLVLLTLIGGMSAVVAVVAARYESRIAPNTYVGIVPVGGLEPAEAAKRLREWWEVKKRVPLKIDCPQIKKPLPDMTPGQLGLTLNDTASVAELPLRDFLGAASGALGQGTEQTQKFDVKYKPNGESLKVLESLVRDAVGKGRPARATYVDGQIKRETELTGLELKKDVLAPEVARALDNDLTVHLPVAEAPKHVSDTQLNSITDVVEAFTTHFPSRMISRNSNIKLASSKLNGVVLLPGERMSFNQTVGRRTIEGGFKEAGIYKNGKHDHGVGGGICQVSSTLYNAALISDLGIRSRHNHSMPVAYLPVGRDATVDYGALDLVIENTYQTPVAISSVYKNGALTFMVLGKKDPGLSVKIVTEGHKSWDRGVKVSQDKSLKPGRFRVTDKGSSGHSIFTYRLVYKDGKLVKREPLGRSFYPGAPRLIASNGPYPPSKAAIVAKTPPKAPLPMLPH